MKLIVFDGYGTLFDAGKENIPAISKMISEEYGIDSNLVYSVWSREYFKLEKNFDQSFMTIIHANTIALTNTFQELGVDVIHVPQWIGLLLEKWSEGKLFPNVCHVFSSLRNQYPFVQLGILSNTDNSTISRAIKNSGLKIDFCVTSEGARAYKPNPKIFMHMLVLKAVEATDCVYIGNSPRDVIGSNAVGIKSIFLNYENHIVPQAKNLLATINNISEVSEILQSII